MLRTAFGYLIAATLAILLAVTLPAAAQSLAYNRDEGLPPLQNEMSQDPACEGYLERQCANVKLLGCPFVVPEGMPCRTMYSLDPRDIVEAHPYVLTEVGCQPLADKKYRQ